MITSKQRAQLRGLANTIETTMQIGKEGISGALITQTEQELSTKELIKFHVLETAMLTAREGCERLCAIVNAEPVQCIGSKFVIYKKNIKNPVIELGK